MSVISKLKSAVGLESDGITVYEYRCNECDAMFESAKQGQRAQCNECLSNDVEIVGEN